MTQGNVIKLRLQDDHDFSAYLSLPSIRNGSAVIILQEIFGINANIRAVADRYAGEGYVAIAPDLFWRQQPGVELDPASAEDRDRATALMKGLDQQLAIKDCLVAADHARSLIGASGKVGAVGYCLGGKLAYLLAMEQGIAAAVSYYGVAIHAALDLAPKLQSPLMLHIANGDQLCPPQAQSAIKEAMQPFGDRVIILEYPDVGHAFARAGSAAYDKASAVRADEATFSFLARELRGAI